MYLKLQYAYYHHGMAIVQPNKYAVQKLSFSESADMVSAGKLSYLSWKQNISEIWLHIKIHSFVLCTTYDFYTNNS